MSRPMEISQAQVAENSFFTKVYLWMSAGLGLSAVTAFITASSPAILKLVYGNPLVFFGLIIGELGLVWWLSASIFRLSVGKAVGFFCLYSALTGVTLAYILIYYTGASVVSTFAITAGTFIFFSVYGYATKADLTRVGQLAFVGLIGIIIASVVNLFLRSPGMYWVITYLGIAIFLGLIAYKTQMLKELFRRGYDSPEMHDKIAIWGALALYISFINLFLMLLRIFGNRR